MTDHGSPDPASTARSGECDGTQAPRPPRAVIPGIIIGLVFAVIYSVIATLVYVAAGFPEGEGAGLPEIILSYFAGGILAGAIIGWLRPYSNTRIGSVIVGIIGAFPVLLGFYLVEFGRIDADGLIVTAPLSVIMGGILGYRFLCDKAQL